MAMRNVMLAIFPQISSVGIKNGRGIEVKSGEFLFIHRNDNSHLMLGGEVLHEANRGAVGDGFSQFIPPGILLGAEVGAVKELLQAQNLDLLPGGLLNEAYMLLYHRVPYLSQGVLGAEHVARLNQATTHNS
jgi:hypothetical protein